MFKTTGKTNANEGTGAPVRTQRTKSFAAFELLIYGIKIPNFLDIKHFCVHEIVGFATPYTFLSLASYPKLERFGILRRIHEINTQPNEIFRQKRVTYYFPIRLVFAFAYASNRNQLARLCQM